MTSTATSSNLWQAYNNLQCNLPQPPVTSTEASSNFQHPAPRFRNFFGKQFTNSGKKDPPAAASKLQCNLQQPRVQPPATSSLSQPLATSANPHHPALHPPPDCSKIRCNLLQPPATSSANCITSSSTLNCNLQSRPATSANPHHILRASQGWWPVLHMARPRSSCKPRILSEEAMKSADEALQCTTFGNALCGAAMLQQFISNIRDSWIRV